MTKPEAVRHFQLRIPSEVHADLELMAWWQRRSMNAQASVILELYLAENAAVLEEARAARARVSNA